MLNGTFLQNPHLLVGPIFLEFCAELSVIIVLPGTYVSKGRSSVSILSPLFLSLSVSLSLSLPLSLSLSLKILMTLQRSVAEMTLNERDKIFHTQTSTPPKRNTITYFNRLNELNYYTYE